MTQLLMTLQAVREKPDWGVRFMSAQAFLKALRAWPVSFRVTPLRMIFFEVVRAYIAWRSSSVDRGKPVISLVNRH